eukprot:Nitzschia sp. Nitz4//scaffold22_size323478//135986//137233//NITZ4_000529-RA/size323478-processed-gene-0.92-mRNA-1//-1//CDS//3329543001//2758//frame0
MSRVEVLSSDDDDDEPLFSSPDPASDPEDDDVFKCKARRFVRLDDNAKTASSSVTTPTPSKPKATTQSRRALTSTQRAQEKRNIQRQEWLEAADSDSDAENVVTTMEDSPFHLAQQEKSKTNPTTKRRLQYENSPSAKKQTIVDLLDSDSEEEGGTTDYVPLAFVNGWNKDAVDVLLQSQLATAKLQMAQQYHAEDVIVPVESPISYKPPTSAASSTKPAPTPARPTNLGQKLRLGCRTQMEINGRKEKPATQMYALHEYEPLSILSNKLCKVLSVPNTARITWTFDGMTLDLKRSPHSYEMEDEDLIDISIKMFVVKDVSTNATSTTAGNTTVNRGPILSLQLRIQAGKHSKISPLQFGANETFQRLEELYRKQQKLRPTAKLTFRFDGFVLDKAKRPVDYDMESEDLIDVTMK